MADLLPKVSEFASFVVEGLNVAWSDACRAKPSPDVVGLNLDATLPTVRGLDIKIPIRTESFIADPAGGVFAEKTRVVADAGVLLVDSVAPVGEGLAARVQDPAAAVQDAPVPGEAVQLGSTVEERVQDSAAPADQAAAAVPGPAPVLVEPGTPAETAAVGFSGWSARVLDQAGPVDLAGARARARAPTAFQDGFQKVFQDVLGFQDAIVPAPAAGSSREAAGFRKRHAEDPGPMSKIPRGSSREAAGFRKRHAEDPGPMRKTSRAETAMSDAGTRRGSGGP